jgi:hypothetical protein
MTPPPSSGAEADYCSCRVTRLSRPAAGTNATVTAVADPNCDGHAVTYTLLLTSPAGTPTSKIDEPAGT